MEVDTKVGVGADADGEVVDALLAGSRELQLHLLLGDQRGEMVGRSDERVGLPVRDINPPELLLIVSVVRTVDTVRHSGLATQGLLTPVHSLLEPGPLLLLVLIVLLTDWPPLLVALTAGLLGARLLPSLGLTSTAGLLSLGVGSCRSLSLSLRFLLGFPRLLARLLGFLLLLRFLPDRTLLLLFFFLIFLFLQFLVH